MSKSNNVPKHATYEASNFSGISGIIRIAISVVIIVIEVVLMFLFNTYIRNASILMAIFTLLFEITVALHILNTIQSPAIRTAWLIVVMVIPIVGCTFYLFWGNVDVDKKEKGYATKSFDHASKHVEFDDTLQARVREEYPDLSKYLNYLEKNKLPVYQNTKSKFYSLGDVWWPALLKDLETAKKFIFMEFFIVNSGEVWESIMDVLCKKAQEGVEVRFMYDDFGSLLTFSKKFFKRLVDAGVQVRAFNRVNRSISSMYLNFRNHQKIVIVDGDVSHVGGTNLSDEYANLFPRLGHWKDTCMRLEGDASWGLTTIFLRMWDLSTQRLSSNYDDYRPTKSFSDKGYYVPMADGPANNPHNPIMDVYKLMISEAKDYCYITSPYLVLDDDMIDRLKLAAKSGADVRLILPRIPDHWYVDLVTHSFYEILLSSGVRIYEYKPGYIHSKMVVADDTTAILGSVNLDFRSFFYHYEDMVWMFDSPIIDEIKQDILNTMAVSEEVDAEKWKSRPLYRRMLESVLRVFAPMM